MMEKNELFDNIKGLNIEIPFQDTIFTVIEKYIDRIEFVKDHIGLRDFLFIAETGTAYQDELFIALDVQARKSKTLEENEQEMLIQYENRPFTVVELLQRFFKDTERILYVGIGFQATEPTEEEYMMIEFSYNSGLIKSKLQAYRELRVKKFPLWYSRHARLPEEIVPHIKEPVTPEEIFEKKEALMKKINHALEKGEKELFLLLTKQYNDL